MDEETTNRLLLLEFISALVKLFRPSVAMNLNEKKLVLLITKIRYSSFVMQIWSHASEVWAGRVVSITYMIISLVTNRISALYRTIGTRWIYYFLQTVSFMAAIIFEKLFRVGPVIFWASGSVSLSIPVHLFSSLLLLNKSFALLSIHFIVASLVFWSCILAFVYSVSLRSMKCILMIFFLFFFHYF